MQITVLGHAEIHASYKRKRRKGSKWRARQTRPRREGCLVVRGHSATIQTFLNSRGDGQAGQHHILIVGSLRTFQDNSRPIVFGPSLSNFQRCAQVRSKRQTQQKDTPPRRSRLVRAAGPAVFLWTADPVQALIRHPSSVPPTYATSPIAPSPSMRIPPHFGYDRGETRTGANRVNWNGPRLEGNFERDEHSPRKKPPKLTRLTSSTTCAAWVRSGCPTSTC